MPPDAGAPPLAPGAAAALADLVAAYAARRSGWDADSPVRVIEAETLVAGRPGLLDVVAQVGDRPTHITFGLRDPGEDGRPAGDGDDSVIGVFDDGDGAAVVVDAMHDPVTATVLLRRVSGEEVDPSLVRPVHEDHTSVTLAMEDRLAFTLYNHVLEGPRPEIEMFLALDESGFNHLAAPVGVWRRSGRDLGLVQEYLPGASSGYALAMTSVRDLYASGGPPELAGGDFGAEAHRLGTMTARMHLSLDKAFGRRSGDLAQWARDIEHVLEELDPGAGERPDVEQLLHELRALQVPSQAIRSHGDFHLDRTCRTEQGWYVVDFAAGGFPTSVAGAVAPPDARGPVFRSPVADVADMLWSFGYVARRAADERDPSGHDGLSELADAWEERNRRAFLAGYLGVPGISGLVPPGREALRVLTRSFEVVREAVHESRLRQA
ncbi:MAG: hypothetical protein ABSG81_09640 [Acidimicrobiales bacterium]|jgi:maltokinase